MDQILPSQKMAYIQMYYLWKIMGMEGERMDVKEAKDILSDMRDQHLCFLGSPEIKDEWQENYLKEA